VTTSFTSKSLRATFTLANSKAVFAGTSGNVLQLTGLRMSVVVVGAGFPAFATATLRIFGMAQADMNALSVQVASAGKTGWLPNTVLVEANSTGDPNGWSAVYAGNIQTAAPDYARAPDVPLVVTSMTKSYDLVNPATPTSFPASSAVADVASVIVAKMGRAFINDGVTAVTSGPTYIPYASADQLRTLCTAYNLEPIFSPDDQVITITPKGSGTSEAAWVLSPSSGLVGYPRPLGNGFIEVRSLFNPAFHIHSKITIQGSDVVIDTTLDASTQLNSLANGDWLVTSIVNSLDALLPEGQWFSDMVLYPPNITAVTT
jgi:hypothetical protein